jgi:hypothetical protein
MKLKTILLSIFLLSIVAVNAQKFITTKGKDIIGIDGKPFLMKGTNLGNWLVPEGYMFKFDNATSPRLINETFLELIGPDATKAFGKNILIHI